ncbi:metallophosphoesterase [Rhodopseudomonas palustris]|uniref:metallophosphoesterase family protein n=1 Tax=Rhodopseudomonas palustris TaxID=1076 RepID=UPI0020CD3FE0|nr:metallophosphoesterase [Rhodopseudomonas palustris]
MADLNTAHFTWLHISDLHVGMQNQNWLWPTVKDRFFADLQMMTESIGEIDLIIFSGDITQQGRSDEFASATALLRELQTRLKTRNTAPPLFVIPGNHDVLRPKKLNAELLILKRWWDFPEVHQSLFEDKDCPYREAALLLFENYRDWTSSLGSSVLSAMSKTTGLFPGDQASVLEANDLRIGLIGLNSSWLQIDGDDYFGKLHVDTRQLLRLTNDNPTLWCKQNDLNLIITHHPTDWLNRDAVAFWESDIFPPGRFDAHLFGHMHEPTTRAVAIGGSLPRHSIQSASLFGLAATRDHSDRIHGYSIARFERNQSYDLVRVWPRTLTKLESGAWKITRDTRFELEEKSGSYVLFKKDRLPPDDGSSREGNPQTSLQVFPADEANAILRKVRFHLATHPAHTNVRRIEQQECLAALQQDRAAWIVAEWGMDSDGFISTIRLAKNETDRPIYKIDVSEFENRDQLFDNIKRRLNCSLDRFCEMISNDPPNYLLLDDIQIPSSNATEGHERPERELEEVAEIILEYCPGLRVIFRSRKRPQQPHYQVVELRALDEADLQSYVRSHDRGGDDLADQSTIISLHRLSDGVPLRVDQALKQLEVVTLSELVSSSVDLSMATATMVGAEPTMVAAVREFSESTDPTQQRAYALLKALSIFPQGEQLIRIKRFYFNAPFFPKHAIELHDQGFLEVTTLQRLDVSSEAQAKTLVVPRSIRECVWQLLGLEELRDLTRRAADLYFGKDWSNGEMKSPTFYKFDNPNCSNGDISNASAIIIRLYNDAHASDDERGMARSLGLARSYLSALSRGDHFHSAVTFCDQLLPNVDIELFPEPLAKLKATFGKCLRMVGATSRARDVLHEVENYELPAGTKQSTLLNLALVYENNDEELAREYAQRVISLDRSSANALHAQAILLQFEKDNEIRAQKLASHEMKCRRQKAFVVANNIALARAELVYSLEEKKAILAPVMVLTREKQDHYNQTRAIIELSQISLQTGRSLGERELSQLIDSYHFLFNERIAGIFDRCHDALWQEFTTTDDKQNLLSLFRHSSLYWRLRGREDRELKYLGEALNSARELVSNSSSRETAYIRARASANGVAQLATSDRSKMLISGHG